MAHKRAQVEEIPAPLPPLEESLPVRLVGVREFRDKLKEICDCDEPVILMRGRGKFAAFIPISLRWWDSDDDVESAIKKMKTTAGRIAEALRNR